MERVPTVLTRILAACTTTTITSILSILTTNYIITRPNLCPGEHG